MELSDLELEKGPSFSPSLARLEAKVMFEEILRRWPRYELADEPTPMPSSLMNGYREMPVRLVA